MNGSARDAQHCLHSWQNVVTTRWPCTTLPSCDRRRIRSHCHCSSANLTKICSALAVSAAAFAAVSSSSHRRICSTCSSSKLAGSVGSAVDCSSAALPSESISLLKNSCAHCCLCNFGDSCTGEASGPPSARSRRPRISSSSDASGLRRRLSAASHSRIALNSADRPRKTALLGS